MVLGESIQGWGAILGGLQWMGGLQGVLGSCGGGSRLVIWVLGGFIGDGGRVLGECTGVAGVHLEVPWSWGVYRGAEGSTGAGESNEGHWAWWGI